jgi:hypothetical protein
LSADALNRVMLRLDRTNRDSFANFHPQITFSVNDLLHTKTLKLTKTLENNKAKSLTNIS